MNWKTKSLDELCEIINGFAFKSKNYVEKGVRVIRITNVQKGSIIDDDPKFHLHDSTYSKYELSSGDLLISLTGNVGRVGILDQALLPAYLNQRVACIRPNEKVLLTKYLFYFLNSDKFEFDSVKNASGVAQKNMSTRWLAKYKIPLPPLKVQQQIVEILDEADALRKKREKTIEKLSILQESIFYEMFGDPIKNTKSWKVSKLSEVGELARGKSKHRPRNAPELLGGPYPLIQTGDVANSGGYITSYDDTYSELGLAQSKMWDKGTLCITIAANIAKTGILTFDACFPDSVVGFTPYKDFVTTEFVQSWMATWQKILEETAPESAQKNINLKILRDMDIIVPPYDKQQQFSSAVNSARDTLKMMDSSRVFTDNLFNSLLQKAFKGALKFT